MPASSHQSCNMISVCKKSEVCPSGLVALNQGWFCPQGISCHAWTSVTVTTEGWVVLLQSWQQPGMLSFWKHTGAPPTTPEWPEASPVLEGSALDEGRQTQLCPDLWGSRALAMALISYAEGTALCDFCLSQGAKSDTCSFLLFHPYLFQEFFIPITAMLTYLPSNR